MLSQLLALLDDLLLTEQSVPVELAAALLAELPAAEGERWVSIAWAHRRPY